MTRPPCFRLLNEIKKNNLVMKEDIYSSTSLKESVALTPQNDRRPSLNYPGNTKETTRRHKQQREIEIADKLNKRPDLIGATSTKKEFTQYPMINTEAVEVYETTGEDNEESIPNRINQSATPDVDALAIDIRFDRRRHEDFWRKFDLSNQHHDSERLNERTQPTKGPNSPCPKEKFMHNTENSLTNEHPSNKICLETPLIANRRPEKYYKLPGLEEAFHKANNNVKHIRIQDGLSYSSDTDESSLDMTSMSKTTTNHMMSKDIKDIFMKETANQTEQQHETETRDAGTGIIIALVNTQTQTGGKGRSIDCSVQCESHEIDEANGRNATKNVHQEIMVCNDSGDGVQLYNELGHPLTDMDGYLLKDSHGRFLVRLDHFGIPTSCTNGQAIFMEDSTPWDAMKSHMSIIHQSRKKPIKRDHPGKKGKARSSMQQLETAMKTLKNTLGMANKIHFDTSNENVLEEVTYYDEGQRRHKNMKPPQDMAKLNNNNNTTSLMAEMKSIARLRNVLLEKVNFIADNRSKLGETEGYPLSPKTKKSANKSFNKNRLDDPTSILARQDRPFSPTFQAIKKLAEEADHWMYLKSPGMNPDQTTANKTLGDHTDFLDSWIDSVKSKTAGIDETNDNKYGRNQLKAVSWINALPSNSLTTKSSDIKKDYNEEDLDLWTFKEHSIDHINANIKQQLEISQTNGYQEIDKDLERLDMAIANEGMENLTGASGLKQIPSKGTPFTGSQLLISLEQQYNLREGSWLETYEPPISRIFEEDSRHGLTQARSDVRPSIEFSSSGSHHF